MFNRIETKCWHRLRIDNDHERRNSVYFFATVCPHATRVPLLQHRTFSDNTACSAVISDVECFLTAALV